MTQGAISGSSCLDPPKRPPEPLKSPPRRTNPPASIPLLYFQLVSTPFPTSPIPLQISCTTTLGTRSPPWSFSCPCATLWDTVIPVSLLALSDNGVKRWTRCIDSEKFCATPTRNYVVTLRHTMKHYVYVSYFQRFTIRIVYRLCITMSYGVVVTLLRCCDVVVSRTMSDRD